MDIITQLTQQMNTILSAAASEYAHALQDTDLRGCQMSYLLAVCQCPGMTQDALAGYLGVDKSNVARQVAVLEEDGFITRTPSAADKRVMELYPTEKTLALMPQLEEIVCQWDKIVTAGISEEEVQTVVRILEIMKSNAAAWVNKK